MTFFFVDGVFESIKYKAVIAFLEFKSRVSFYSFC